MYGLREFFCFLTNLNVCVSVLLSCGGPSLSGSSLGRMKSGETPADLARSWWKDEAARLLDNWRGSSQVRAIPNKLHPDQPLSGWPWYLST